MMDRRNFLTLGCGALCSLALAGPARSAVGGMSVRYPNWKTVCVGRYLVDVPAEAKVTGEWFIDDNKVQKLGYTPEQARTLVKERIAKLKQTQHKTMGSMFIKTIPLPGDGVIIQSWALPNDTISNTLFLYAAVGSGRKTIYHVEVLFGLSRKEYVIDKYTQIGSSLLAVKPGEIPREAGFCMDEILLLDTPLPRDESCTMGIVLPGAPQLTLGIHTFIVQAKPNPLHAGELPKRLWQLAGSDGITLRNGPHPVDSLPGYEICVAGVEPDSRYRVFSYLWYAPGEVQNNNKPAVRLDMGYTRLSPLAASGPRPFGTDEESLVFWDRVVNSIRFRPVR
jgi:hypothetical protein